MAENSVEIFFREPRKGRNVGRKFEIFTLNSGEKVQLYFVPEDFRGSGGKAFYARIKGAEFVSDNPILIPTEIVKWLQTQKEPTWEPVILIGDRNCAGVAWLYIFDFRISRLYQGIQGDGSILWKDWGPNEAPYQARNHRGTLIKYTEERWKRLEEMSRRVKVISSKVETIFRGKPEAIAEALDKGTVLEEIK